MARVRPQQAEAVAAQHLEALTGFEAVAQIERAICRSRVSREPAVAEGLALAGRRSASLGGGPPGGSPGGILLGDASCVHHVEEGVALDGAGAFELRAASVQEAVDHSVLAHLLSRRLRRPGMCALPRSLTRELTLVRFPGDELLARLLDADSQTGEPDAGPARILELAGEAAREISKWLGRPVELIDFRGADKGRLVIVGAGNEATQIREVARLLSEAGVPTGALSVNLVRPFPEAAVRTALASVRTVMVVEDPGRGGALLARVRACIDGESAIYPLESASPERLYELVTAHLIDENVPGRPETSEPPLGRRLVVTPAGAWAEEVVRHVVSAIGQLGPLRLAPRTRSHRGATVLVWGGDAAPEGDRDLLLASHPALLDPRGALGLVRADGAAVVLSDAGSSEELARRLSPEAREFLRERQVRVQWMPHPDGDAAERAAPIDRATFLVLAGAAVAEVGRRSKRGKSDPAGRVSERLEAAGRHAEARWLREGATRVQTLDPADLDPSRHIQEVDFRPASTLPRLAPAVEDTDAQKRWTEQIRRFHQTGAGGLGSASGLPVRPAALDGLASAMRAESRHPFVLLRATDEAGRGSLAARGVRDVVAEALAAEGSAPPALLDNLDWLVATAGRILARRSQGAHLQRLVEEAGRRLATRLGLAKEAETQLNEGVERLASRLPEGTVLDLRSDTAERLYVEALDAVRSPVHQRFEKELEGLRERLRDLLQLDRMRTPEGSAPEAVAATLGGAATNYVDPEALSRTLRKSSAPDALDPQRRARIEKSLDTLERYCEGRDRPPRLVVLRPPELAAQVAIDRQEVHPDPLAAAIGMFDGMANRFADLLRAVRTARLEAAGHYRPDRHDEALERLDWEAFTAEELALVPAVAVFTTGRRLRERDQGALSELLRSSRPVHVIVQDDVAPEDEAEDLSRYHIDLGHLVVAHREAYAVASTLARPDLLVEALTHLARALRPAVALMRLPAAQPFAGRTLRAEAGLHGRACPDFRYDPDAGRSWGERFDLTGNPQPECAWPIHRLPYLEDGEEKSLEVAFTFADAVALDPAYLRHLLNVPRAAWSEDQIPLAEYLEGFDPEGGQRAIPYLWVIDDEGLLQRAVVTRELALACRDRLRAWRVLQELAGYDNLFAARAASAARDQALAEADATRAQLEQWHAEELERVRTETARESIERVAAALMSPEGLSLAPSAPVAPRPAAAPVPAAVEAAAPAAEPAAAPAPAAPAAEEETLSFDEPWIDSALCTTCNECTNINAQLFNYNADKQAFIADAKAGTFEELVKAAELCPALCIHPGKPRAEDSTGTPQMIERAAKFN